VTDLGDVRVFGPALPEPFVRFDLEAQLARLKLWPRPTGEPGKAFAARWEVYRRRLRRLNEGGPQRVYSHVLAPLAEDLGYTRVERCEAETRTREGMEDAGWQFVAPDGTTLRAWSCAHDVHLDAPSKRGDAYRFSPTRIAERVLDSLGERIAVLTNGADLRLLVRGGGNTGYTHLDVDLGTGNGWRSAPALPDSYRLVHALVSPAGVARMGELTEFARLSQTRVTTKLRQQAQQAVVGFVQALLDDEENRGRWPNDLDRQELARDLWHEALIIVYRLLLILCLEDAPEVARRFSFASTALWRGTYSPRSALPPVVRRVLDQHADTGSFLADGLRALFDMFANGLRSLELRVDPLGGAIFGSDTTPLLSPLHWSERAVAVLLDNLLWTPAGRHQRQRVHYGSLDVEELGRVYEALLELEPGIARAPMCRLRRAKLEIVVPIAQGAAYRGNQATGDDDDDDESDEDEGKSKTKVVWVEDIPEGRYYLSVGLGRKATGSYYTPRAFVRFLLQETLTPQIAARSSDADPQPGKILALNVLDPAMGSGHFLVEACRLLGDKIYEACRMCDELASRAEQEAEKAAGASAKQAHLARAAELRQRIEALSRDGALASYLPSRVPEGGDVGLSEGKARALCRRLAAVNCLYGVDKNPLAVELARVALWLESHAEGFPLTFLNHRLVRGDSIIGPSWDDMLTLPSSGLPAEDVLARGLTDRLATAFYAALRETREFLEARIDVTPADLLTKQAAKDRADAALAPLIELAHAWTGGAMLPLGEIDDSGYQALARAVAAGEPPGDALAAHPRLAAMLAAGEEGVPFELTFPEVFFPEGAQGPRRGFDLVVGNPPWDALQPLAKEFFAAFDLRVLDAPTRRERAEVEKRVQADPEIKRRYAAYTEGFDHRKRLLARLYEHINRQAGGQPSGAVNDLWQPFAERALTRWTAPDGRVGLVLPSAFHANQSATGLRALYLRENQLETCFSFENVNKLFEIDSRFKFAVVAARHGHTGQPSRCAFYLHNLEWLAAPTGVLLYDGEFIEHTGGAYLSLVELRTEQDALLAAAVYKDAQPLNGVLATHQISVGREFHMTDDAWRFINAETVISGVEDPREPTTAAALRDAGYLPLYEGKHFHQFNDRWAERPRYLVPFANFRGRSDVLTLAGHYRLAFRDIARSTDERTGIFTLIPPGSVCGNTAPCERTPSFRRISTCLQVLAVFDSYSFDWALRQKSAAHVNLFILHGCPFPNKIRDAPRGGFLAHAALRLTCNHAGYAPMWREQLKDAWREPTPPHTWPVLDGDDARWQVRAAIDAVVADAYGLTRAQYEHLLSSFTHRSYPAAPGLCLAAFDELRALGLDAFTRKHDPYADIPEVDTLPEPVLDLRPPGQAAPDGANTQRRLDGSFESAQLGLLGPAAEPPAPPTPKKTRGRPRRGS
jgi:hypothetical protein